MKATNTPQKETSDLLTRQDVSRLLGVSLMTLHRWSTKGFLVPKHLGDRVVRYRLSDVEDFVNGKEKAK